jgi:thiol-disulfide isomerase/thioredoxin
VNKKIVMAALAIVVVVSAVLVAAYFVLSDDEKKPLADGVKITEEELAAFRVTLYEEKIKIDLHDVTTLEGLPFDSSDIPKKYVMLTFWATWCKYCNLENPSVQSLYDERAGEKFTILTVSIDGTISVVENYLKEYEYDFPVVINVKGNLRAEYAPGVPTTYILSPDGYVIAKMVGSRNWDSEEASLVLDYLTSLK